MAAGDTSDIREGWKAIWEAEHADRDGAIAAAIARHAESEDHKRPRGLASLIFQFDSGALGTSLTVATLHPAGIEVPFPAIANTWRIRVPPESAAGTCLLDVYLSPPPAADADAETPLPAATTMCVDDDIDARPRMTVANRRAEGAALGQWPITTIPAHSYVHSRVIESSLLSRVELHVEVRRT